MGCSNSPLIYPANRTRSDRRPRRIRCYKMCSIDSGLWCWDATTDAVSDDGPSQRRGWWGVFSFSFEVRVRQGRVTLPCKSSRGVRAPNSMSTAFKPPNDRQTERTNQGLQCYLRTFVKYDHTNWYQLLPLVQHAYNNSATNGHKMTPFFANYGFHERESSS